MGIGRALGYTWDVKIVINGVDIAPEDIAYLKHKISELTTKVDALLAMLTAIAFKEDRIMADLASLQQAVNDETSVEQSAITLMTQLSALLTQAKNDPAQIQSIIDQINTRKAALADAIVANTPAQT